MRYRDPSTKSRTASKTSKRTELRLKHTPISNSLEASRSIYTYLFLLAAVNNGHQSFYIIPEEKIDGPHQWIMLSYRPIQLK